MPKIEKFLLVDGNLLMFQSFYASYSPYYEPMHNKEGITTNGIHVFFTTLFRLIKKFKPKYMFVAFDSDSNTWRKQEFSDYKAGREKAPLIIFEQLKYVKQLLTDLKIPWLEKSGDEADDLIATLAASNDYLWNIVFSKDKDLLQLVNENTIVYKYDSYNKEYITIDYKNFYDYYRIEPEQIPDFKGLAGDNSDNLRGVKGIGDKTAINLLNKYHTLENIYEHLDECKESVKNKLIIDKESAFKCKRLAVLNRLVDMDKNIENYQFFIDKKTPISLLEKLELDTILNQLEEI